MLTQISEMDSLRKTCKRNRFLLLIFTLSISFFFMLLSANPINSQIEEALAVDELDIGEIEDEIELSPGVDPLLDEDSSCKCYEFVEIGTSPSFFYYADDILSSYKDTLKVELVDAQSMEVVKVRKNEKQKTRTYWKSKVEEDDFIVIENWTLKPANHHNFYRLRWKIDNRTSEEDEEIDFCFSEPFRIIQ